MFRFEEPAYLYLLLLLPLLAASTFILIIERGRLFVNSEIRC